MRIDCSLQDLSEALMSQVSVSHLLQCWMLEDLVQTWSDGLTVNDLESLTHWTDSTCSRKLSKTSVIWKKLEVCVIMCWADQCVMNIISQIILVVYMQISCFHIRENPSQRSRPVSPDSRASFCFTAAEGQISLLSYQPLQINNKMPLFAPAGLWGFINKLNKDISWKIRNRESVWRRESESCTKHISMDANQQLFTFTVWRVTVILINTDCAE